MKDTVQTAQNDSNTNGINVSKSSLKGLDQEQLNGNIRMSEDKLQELPLKNGAPQASESVQSHLGSLDDHKPKQKRNEISDSSSSFSSLSSDSDDEVVECFKKSNDEVLSNSHRESINSNGIPQEDQENDKLKKETEIIRKERDQAKEQLGIANQQLETLIADLEEVRKSSDELKTNNQHVIDEMNRQVTSLSENRERLKEELDKTKDELIESKSSNEKLQNDMKDITLKLQTTMKEYDEIKEKSELVDKENERKQTEDIEKEAAFNERILKLQHEVQSKDQELNQQRERIEEQEKLQAEKLDEMEKTMKSEEESHKKEVDNLKKELETAKESSTDNSDSENVKDELERYKTKAEKQQKEINELTEKLESAQKEIESKEAYGNELQTLKDELKSYNTKNEKQQEEIRELTGKLQSVQKEIESKVSGGDELQTLKDELISYKAKNEKQQEEISELTENLESAQKEIESKEADANELQSLKDELKVLLSKIETREQEAADLADQLELSRSDIIENGKDETSIGVLLREQLVNAKATIRSVNQANSKLEAKLSNAQTIIETGEVEHKKSREEIKALKDKIKWMERRKEQSTPKTSPRSEGPSREELERKLQHESLRRSQERIRDLEQKIIQVNEDKKKLKHDYEEAVKALEAVDKVYSVREMALQQYKTDLEEANDTIKKQTGELLQSKMESEKLTQDQEKMEKDMKHQQELMEEVKDQLTRSKEAVAIYKTEIDQVRKEFQDQIHELQVAQAKARDRGKKIQLIELELNETKDALQISKNVIDEKKNNMETLQQSLENEKKNCKNLENQLDEMFYLKKKLKLIEDEKARVVEKLRETEKDLERANEAVRGGFIKYQALEAKCEDALEKLLNSEEINKSLCEKLEDHKYQIDGLKSIVESKEADVEQQLLDIIYYRDQMDDLTIQLQELWATYNADRTLGKTGKQLRRRPQSASNRRAPKAPSYQSPTSKPHTYAHRRVVNKLGEPVINQNYINSTHKSLPKALPPAQDIQQDAIESSPDGQPSHSPRPPNGTKPRPLSSYGIRTNGMVNGEKEEDLWMYRDTNSSANGDVDEQIINFLVNIGDRVIIQSKVVGEELLNVSGVVRFVGKVGQKTSASPTYVGLKLDQPFADKNKSESSREFFKIPPRNGKLIKMPDIFPKAPNGKRVKSATANW